MTVSSTTTKVSYSGNGSTTVFAYGFKIFADADLRVIERAADGTETVKSLTTHYTVSGAGTDSGGNVTFGTAPASGVTVIIKRNLTLTQGTDYVANDPFPAESHEEALDRLTFIAQGIQEELDRTIKASETNTISGAEFTVSATDRANKIFAFDSSGDLSVTQELGTFRGDWATSTAYAVRDLVKDTSTNNIFIVNTAHTSSGAQPLTSNANSAKYDLIVDAATATSAQTAAASSASSASTSASTATTKASEAATSAAASAVSATAAAASETASAASETASAASETASAASETASAASQTAAAASATSASTSASTATTKASEASTSAATATTKASEAASSQTAAASSASSASTDAGTATTKAAEASTSASNSAASATAAASSATAAAASQTAAAASAASAASAFDNFDDTYLGSKTSNPTVDNDGDALVAGALYFNSTANEMRVYDGANWIAATSAGNVSLILYEYTATAGQTTFSGSDDNSATLSYTVDNLQVVMNGVILDPSDFTATNGTSVVLASGAAANDLVNIYAFKSFTTADMVSKTAGGTFSGAVTVPQLNADNLRLDGNTISTTSGDMTLDAVGDVIIDADGADIRLKHAGTEWGRFVDSTNNFLILNPIADKDIIFNGIDGSSEISALTLDMSDAGKAVFNAGATFGGNVGISEASPAAPLHISTGASTTAELRLTSNNTGSGSGDRGRIAVHSSRNDGTAYEAGRIDIDRSSGTEDKAHILFATNNGSGVQERVRLTADGKVGIGTDNPINTFQVNGDAVRFYNSADTDALHLFGFNNSNHADYSMYTASGNNNVKISTSETSFFNGGDVLIGATSRSNVERVNISYARATHCGMVIDCTDSTAITAAIKFFNTNGDVGSIDMSGSSTSYTTSSDHRLKQGVEDMTGAIDRVKALAPKRFQFIADADTTVDGFLAHEAQAVVPEAVTGTKDEVDEDGNAVMQGIDQSKLVPLLTGALREAIAKIETLETKVAALEAAE